MMKTAKIKYNGIARAASQQDITDGFCDEIVNLRYRAGKLQAKGIPTAVKNMPVEIDSTQPEAGPQVITWKQIWWHNQDNVDNYVGFTNIAYDQNTLRRINFESGETIVIKAYTNVLSVHFLKSFMIVIHSDGMDKYLWKDGEYKAVAVNIVPQYSLYLSDEKLITSDEVEGPFTASELPEQARGFFYDKINEVSADNYFTGTMFVRAALKLFDGSYVLHTLPRSISLNDLGLGIYYDKTPTFANVAITFSAAKLKVILLKSFYEQFEDVKDIVSEVVLFASKFETVIKLDDSIDDEIEDALDSASLNLNQTLWLNDIITTVNSEYKTLCDTPSWYKAGEWGIGNIIEDDVNEEIDLNNFYQDYATRETLPVDSFSHHEVSGKVGFNYNSRMIIADTVTKFGDYRYFPLNPDVYGAGENLIVPPGYTESGTLKIRFLTTISTSNGEILKLGQEFTRPKFIKPGEAGTVYYVSLGIGLFGYPDSRATKIEVLYNSGSNWIKSPVSYNLKKSKYDNYAYYTDTDYNTSRQDHYFGTANYPIVFTRIDTAIVTVVNPDAYPDVPLSDENRVQISELTNPFYFPAENSYQVGTSRILQVAANTEPLSTGQFGEYPLIVFSETGTWAMLQGQGDVLFSSVKPLNGEVINNPDTIIPIPGGVTFTTDLGLYIQSGGKTVNLSELLQGKPNDNLTDTNNFKLRINHLSLIQLPDAISQVDFLNYLPGAKIGYEKVLNELLVTNSNYNYSYVYSFENNKWTKISWSYSMLINAYPKLLAPSGASLMDFGAENFNVPVSAFIVTRPCKIDGEIDFVLLHRSLQRCEIETKANTFAGFYVFGSNDLLTWQLIAGNDRKTGRITDILTTRAHLKVKYFVFVFVSTLKEYSTVNTVEVQFYSKLTNKIR